jgi:excisionase family DNA binding protein
VSDRIALPLPDGRWIALTPETLREGLDAARGFGLESNAAPVVPANGVAERWLTSEELGELTSVHSTTWESKAKSGEVPHLRVGKSLRFRLSEVEAALRARTQP